MLKRKQRRERAEIANLGYRHRMTFSEGFTDFSSSTHAYVCDPSLTFHSVAMFRTAVRRAAATAFRAAEVATGSASQMESANPYTLKMSSAQGAVDGFVGGKIFVSVR